MVWKHLYIFLWIYFLSDIYLGKKLLAHVIILLLHCWETARLLSQVAAPLHIPASSVWSFDFFTSSQDLVLPLSLFVPSQCVWTHIFLWFWLAFPSLLMILCIFYMVLFFANCTSSLEECWFQQVAHLKFGVF